MSRTLVGALSVGAVLTGCGTSEPPAADDPSPSTVDEIGLHGGEVCPPQLPAGSHGDNGLGPDKNATSAPSLPQIDQAWVCVYWPVKSGRSDEGVVYEWERHGGVLDIPTDALVGLHGTLGGLAPPSVEERMCTADLGPRHLLAYADGRDLTGVAVDEFGCDDVRLTDDPFETEPGTSAEPGIVPGVLEAPPGLAVFLRKVVRQSEPRDAEPDGYIPPLVEDPTAPVPDGVDVLAHEFVQYALGTTDTFPHANSVRFKLSGRDIKWLDDIDGALPDRRIWRGCPGDWEGYAGAGCPVDLLGPIVSASLNQHSLVYTSHFEEFVCAPPHEGQPPTGRFVVLRPDPEWRSCAGNFALILGADRQGRLDSVDLILAEP